MLQLASTIPFLHPLYQLAKSARQYPYTPGLHPKQCCLTGLCLLKKSIALREHDTKQKGKERKNERPREEGDYKF